MPLSDMSSRAHDARDTRAEVCRPARRRALAGMAEEQVEHRPDEGEAAGLAGEAAHHLGAPADPPKRPLEEIRASPPFAVPERIAQVHDERVEVVGQATGGRLVAAMLEL